MQTTEIDPRLMRTLLCFQEGGESSSHAAAGKQVNEKALLARIWGDFDARYMKPFLTDSRPTLLETLPVCCNPIARLLTTTTQLTQVDIADVSMLACFICLKF